MQQEVAKSFLRSFQLTPVELSALREANITEDFFSALERVQMIHTNCRTLMQSGHQTSALDIMDQMAMYQVSLSHADYWVCYEHLYCNLNKTTHVSRKND